MARSTAAMSALRKAPSMRSDREPVANGRVEEGERHQNETGWHVTLQDTAFEAPLDEFWRLLTPPACTALLARVQFIAAGGPIDGTRPLRPARTIGGR